MRYTPGKGVSHDRRERPRLERPGTGALFRRKQNLAAAKARIEKTGKEMSDVGSELRNKPSQHWIGFNFNSFSWLIKEAIQQLAEDVTLAEKEVQDAKIKAINLGVALSE